MSDVYGYLFRCENCTSPVPVEIPKGTSVTEFLVQPAALECQNCGCTGYVTDTYGKT